MVPLRSAQDFSLLRHKGRRFSPAPWLMLQWKTNVTGEIRLGCTLPKYVGSAVVRNRIRRWCREHVRKWSEPMKESEALDLNILFHRQKADFYKRLSHEELDASLGKALGRISRHDR
jgi:ribonuclease P protein component